MSRMFCGALIHNGKDGVLGDPQRPGYLSAGHFTSAMHQQFAALLAEDKAFMFSSTPSEISSLEAITGPLLKADFLRELTSLQKMFPRGVETPSDAQFERLAIEISDAGRQLNAMKGRETLADAATAGLDLAKIKASEMVNGMVRVAIADVGGISAALSPNPPCPQASSEVPRRRPR